MGKTYDMKFIVVSFLWINLMISCVSGITCSCPQNQQILSEKSISGIESIQFDHPFTNDDVVEYIDIIKNGKCTFRWTPKFRKNRMVSQLDFSKLIEIEPCFENHDTIEMRLSPGKCCQAESLLVANNLRIDTSLPSKLNFNIHFDESRYHAMNWELDITQKTVPKCWPSTQNLDFVTLNNISNLMLFNSEISENLIGWQFIQNEYCYFNIFDTDAITIGKFDMFEMFDKNACRRDFANIFVTPLYGDGNDASHCGDLLPYRLNFNDDETSRKISITMTEVNEKQVVATCSVEYVDADGFALTGDCLQQQDSVDQEKAPCKCFGAQPFNFEEPRGINQMHFSGIMESWNISFIISNKRDYTQTKLYVEDSKTIDLNQTSIDFKSGDLFDLIAYSPHCSCQNRLEVLVENLVFDQSLNHQIQLTWNHESHQDFNGLEPDVDIISMPRSLVATNEQGQVTRCLVSDKHVRSVVLDDNREFNFIGKLRNDYANAVEVWFSPDCYGRFYGTAVDNDNNLVQFKLSQLNIQMRENLGEKCSFKDSLGRTTDYKPLNGYIVPIRVNDAKDIIECHQPLPYKYQLNWPLADNFYYHTTIDWSFEEQRFIQACWSTINLANTIQHYTVDREACENMDARCSKCIGNYHMSPDEAICFPELLFFQMYQSVAISFVGIVSHWDNWNFIVEVRIRNEDQELSTIIRKEFDQNEFEKKNWMHDLIPGDYVLEYSAINLDTKYRTQPESHYFKVECASNSMSVMANATNAVVTFPNYFDGNLFVYTVYDLSTFETHYPLMDHTDIRITANEANNLKLVGLTPGTVYKIEFYAFDAAEEFHVRPCEDIYFKTSCNCGPQVGDDAPIVNSITGITQSRGFVSFQFKDNSRCDQGYAFERQLAYLSGSFSQPVVFTPVFFNYNNDDCFATISTGKVAADDLEISKLRVGDTYRYSIRGVAAGYDGTPSYLSHTVRWESSVSGVISLPSRMSGLPIDGVKVDWKLKDLKDNVVKAGSTVTNSAGRFQISFNELVKFLNYEAYPLELSFEKTSTMADGTKSNHVFLCDEDRTDCTLEGTTLYLKHLSFDQEIRVTDASAVPISGSVYVANTQSTGKDGCPLANVEVCLMDKVAREENVEIVCVETTADGTYNLAAPIGSRITLQATYGNHSFEFIPKESKYKAEVDAGLVVEESSIYKGFNFQDITTATLDVAVAGGLCDIYLGEASLLFTIDGCAWGGKSVKQSSVNGRYTLPAQKTNVAVNRIAQRDDISFDFQVINLTAHMAPSLDNRGDSYGTDSELSFNMRFQYDGKPIIRTIFTENMNSDCSNTEYDRLVVLPFETPMYAVIYLSRDLGLGKICDNVDPSTTLHIENGLGLLPDDSSDKEFKEVLSTKYPSEVVDLYEVCSTGCNLNIIRDFDNVTQRYKSSRVEFLFITGRPNIMEGHRKQFTVVPNEPFAKPYVADVVVVGQYKISDKFSVGLPTYDPVLIIRDPPGGGSSSFYQNVQTSMRVNSRDVKAYTGSDFGLDEAIGFKTNLESCAGLFIEVCTQILNSKTTVQGVITEGESTLNSWEHTYTSGEFTTTWSYTSSTDPFLAGEKSDVFVVPNLDVNYAETGIVEWDAATCTATYKEDITFYLRSPDNGPAVAFVSVYEIEHVEIPSLLSVIQSYEEKFNSCEDEVDCVEFKEIIDSAEDAIKGWTKALKMNQELKQQAKGGGSGLVRPGQWFDKIISPQFANNSIGRDDMQINSALASSELLSKAKLRERYETASARTPDLNQVNAIKFSGGGSSFTYKLNHKQLQKHTEMLGGNNENFDSTTTQGLQEHSEFSIAGILNEQNLNKFSIDKTSVSHTLDIKSEKETAIGFTLSDPNIGDVFDVEIFIDPLFGTFVFNTKSGRSMCPVEQGTEARVVPRMEIVSTPPHIVLPDRPMVFELKISNIGDFPGSFVLNYENLNATYGGLTFYRILPLTFDRIEPGETVYTTFSIFRGPVEYEYPPMALKLQLACESGQDMKLVGDDGKCGVTTVVPLFNQIVNGEEKLVFAEPCPKIHLEGEIKRNQGFAVTRTSNSNNNLPVLVRNPLGSHMSLSSATKLASTRLQQVQLQYRRTSTLDWQVGQHRVGDGKLVDIDLAAEGLEDEYGFISVDWALAALADGDYEFRVVSMCQSLPDASEEFSMFSTEVIKGTVDRTLPQLFGLPTPFGKLEVDEEILFEFDKVLDCSEPYRFSVSLEVDSEAMALTNKDLQIICEERSIAIMFDSSQYDTTQFIGKTLNLDIANVSDIHENVLDEVLLYQAEIVQVPLERRRLMESENKKDEIREIADNIESAGRSVAAKQLETLKHLQAELLELRNSQTYVEYVAASLGFFAFTIILFTICCRQCRRVASSNIVEPTEDYDSISYSALKSGYHPNGAFGFIRR